MGYLGDPREQAIDIDNHVIWEADNRIEERWQYNAAIDDYCGMSPEEFMKTPIIEAIKNGSGGGGGSAADCECIKEATDRITESIENAVVSSNKNNDKNTNNIITTIESSTTRIVTAVQSSITLELLFYYGQINHRVDPQNVPKSIFQPSIVAIGSETYFDYILGDPNETDWQRYLDGEITEQELRQLSCNDYYLAIPVAYEGKMVLQENGTVDITDSFVKVDGLNLFDGYVIYRSVDVDYFNEDYESGETNVRIPFKITITK